jgi:gliding motility-associated-like protein
VTVNPIVTPTFSFGTSVAICEGGQVPTLPSVADNGITGTWSPATINAFASSSYTFTPNAGQCAIRITLTVTVNQNITPAFDFGTIMTICAGDKVPELPTTSTNGIKGTWTPSAIDHTTSATYMFTPDAGQCATAPTLAVTVNPYIIPTFSFGRTLTVCEGSAVPTLPTTSDNGITGTWSPATISDKASDVYTFTPDVVTGQCISSQTFTVTVNTLVAPVFDFQKEITLCSGSTAPTLSGRSINGINGTWSPGMIDNKTSGVYTFTPTPGQCATGTSTITVTVPPIATMAAIKDTTVTDGMTLSSYTFNSIVPGVDYNWSNSNTAIGLSGYGTNVVPSFVAINKGATPISSTVTVTPMINGCAGIAQKYVINVLPLDKDVFVPNIFTPNGDGKNDLLFVYGNYINKVDMRIFNQWGELIEKIDNKTKGWDGKHKGKPQPVGVYVYVLQAEMTDGRIIKLKGYINLLR